MTNNEFLKDLYGRYPEKWIAEVKTLTEWRQVPNPVWFPKAKYRLRPIVPEGYEPVPDEAHAYGPDKPGAVCLHGPLAMPDNMIGFSGWYFRRGRWEYEKYWLGTSYRLYLIDCTYSRGHKIISLNRPKKCELKPLIPSAVRGALDALNHRIQKLEDQLNSTNEIPPGESEWMRLDKCEFDYIGPQQCESGEKSDE